MEMTELAATGQRFRRIPRSTFFSTSDVDPVLNENLDQWPHLKELVHCYKADGSKDETKYGQYESVPLPSFQGQIFEAADTDIETELRLANMRQGRDGDARDDEESSTSGRQFTGSNLPKLCYTKTLSG
eukprot:c221_g1_i1 orf=194-580(+)